MRPNSFICGLLLSLTLSLPAYAQSDEGKIAFQKHDYPTALQVWGLQAEHGNAGAQNGLGRLYLYGLGVPQDTEKAITWLRKAAGLNYPNAQLSP